MFATATCAPIADNDGVGRRMISAAVRSQRTAIASLLLAVFVLWWRHHKMSTRHDGDTHRAFKLKRRVQRAGFSDI